MTVQYRIPWERITAVWIACLTLISAFSIVLVH